MPVCVPGKVIPVPIPAIGGAFRTTLTVEEDAATFLPVVFVMWVHGFPQDSRGPLVAADVDAAIGGAIYPGICDTNFSDSSNAQ